MRQRHGTVQRLRGLDCKIKSVPYNSNHGFIYGVCLFFWQAFGLHGHEEEGHGHNPDEHEDEKEVVWKALLLMASIYVFFLFETLMHLCLKVKVAEKNGYSHTDVEVSSLLE